jgi:hypothetical protein
VVAVSTVPTNQSKSEFLEWARAVAEPRSQHPIDEILAEHHLMRVVLQAIQKETLRLSRQRELRLEFWSGAVDFVGNFGLLYHWRKKANHLPELDALGFGDAVKRLEDRQTHDIDLTLEFTDSVQDGDIEKLTRLVALLVMVKREKMDLEERELLLPARSVMPPERTEALRAAFDQVEKKALPERGRKEYLELAKRLCVIAGASDPTL